ncbi:uncharacterized protein LOC115717973 [Cannabis sativa]|uniref:uncharacterized protein LOC115717973 n=1 Tax=Cannabis sativa TaxID=3483 RepID=UPI0029C9C022|nr:uncharacterized protein LOC115717973 [Cannabis sativa]
MATNSWDMKGIEEEILRVQVAEEEEDVAIEGGEEDDGIDARWCVVGRFLSDRDVDFETMQNVLASLWKPGMGMFVKELPPDRYFFQFYHEVDIQRVITGSPWTFNRMQLILTRLQEGDDPQKVLLKKLDIWVQVYDLQPGCMSVSVLRNVANVMGRFVESDPKNFVGVWRDYFRVRVTIDINKPLRRRMRLTKPDGANFWATFKYERAPTFCFICGIIGHSEKFCVKLFEKPLDQIVKPYGEFMRAKFQNRKQNIGARWLRTRGWTPGMVVGESSGAGEMGQADDTHMESDNQGTNGGEIGGDTMGFHNQGVNVGDMQVGQNSQYENNPINGINEERNEMPPGLHANGSVVIIDNKRRKATEELEKEASGLGLESNGLSKNSDLAGLSYGARPTL